MSQDDIEELLTNADAIMDRLQSVREPEFQFMLPKDRRAFKATLLQDIADWRFKLRLARIPRVAQ